MKSQMAPSIPQKKRALSVVSQAMGDPGAGNHLLFLLKLKTLSQVSNQHNFLPSLFLVSGDTITRHQNNDTETCSNRMGNNTLILELPPTKALCCLSFLHPPPLINLISATPSTAPFPGWDVPDMAWKHPAVLSGSCRTSAKHVLLLSPLCVHVLFLNSHAKGCSSISQGTLELL